MTVLWKLESPVQEPGHELPAELPISAVTGNSAEVTGPPLAALLGL